MKARAEVVVDRPADVVWARIRDFGDVSWLANTERSRRDGDTRIVRMKNTTFDIVQELLHQDDKTRICRYSMAETIIGQGSRMPKLEAAIAVTPRGESSAWVTYDVDTEEPFVAAIHASYQRSLDNLKTLLEDRPKARAETIIDRPADVVWARIRDFGDVSWIPNTASCVLDGDVRRIRMVGRNFDVVERLLGRDDSGRTYSYDLAKALDLEAVFGPGWKVSRLLASLTVTPKGEASSRVIWDIHDTADVFLAPMHAEYQAALDHLKGLLESQEKG